MPYIYLYIYIYIFKTINVENSYQNRFLRKAEMNSVLSLLFCHRCEIDRHSTVSNEIGHISIVRT